MDVIINKDNIILNYENESNTEKNMFDLNFHKDISARDPEDTEKERIKFSFEKEGSSIKIVPRDGIEMHEILTQLESYGLIQKKPEATAIYSLTIKKAAADQRNGAHRKPCIIL
jgi:hypothetical protein